MDHLLWPNGIGNAASIKKTKIERDANGNAVYTGYAPSLDFDEDVAGWVIEKRGFDANNREITCHRFYGEDVTWASRASLRVPRLAVANAVLGAVSAAARAYNKIKKAYPTVAAIGVSAKVNTFAKRPRSAAGSVSVSAKAAATKRSYTKLATASASMRVAANIHVNKKLVPSPKYATAVSGISVGARVTAGKQ